MYKILQKHGFRIFTLNFIKSLFYGILKCNPIKTTALDINLNFSIKYIQTDNTNRLITHF